LPKPAEPGQAHRLDHRLGIAEFQWQALGFLEVDDAGWNISMAQRCAAMEMVSRPISLQV